MNRATRRPPAKKPRSARALKDTFCPVLSLGLAAFLLPAALLLITYLLRGLVRGSEAILYSELDSSYLALIRLLKDPDSLGALLVSVEGGEAVRAATFAASPLNYLIALFPLASASGAVALVSAIRAGLSGLTFSIYLSERRLPAYARLSFSTMYALSSYAILMTYSIAYIDTLILFPLLMLGIERLIRGRRISLFAATLALSLLTNPFAIVPLLLFSLLYAIYLSVLSAKALREHLWDAAALLGTALVSVATAAITLIPLLSALTPNADAYHFVTSFDFLDFLAKALPGSYDGAADAHLPYLYVGMAPLLLIPIYFASPRIPKRERIATGAMWFLLYFSFSIQSINGAWSLLSPSIPSYAHAVIFIFLFLSASARAFSVLDGAAERLLLVSAGVLALLITVIQKLDPTYKISDGETEQSIAFVSDVPALWLSLLFIVILTAALSVLCHRGDGKLSAKAVRSAALALLLTVSVEAVASSSELIKLIDQDGGYPERSELAVYDRAAKAGNALLDKNPLYRLEWTDKRTESDSLLYRFPSLLDYRPDVLAALGIQTDELGAVTKVASPLMLSILGVRYFVERETVKSYTEDGILLEDRPKGLPIELEGEYLLTADSPIDGKNKSPLVYENSDALPLLFVGSSKVGSVTFSSNVTTLETVNTLFEALTDGACSPYLKAEFTAQNYYVSETAALAGYTVYEKTPTRGYQIEYRVTAVTDGPLYFSLFSLYPRAAAVHAPGVSDMLFEESEDSTLGTVCLGEYKSGQGVTVRLNFEKSSDQRFYIPDGSAIFWQEDSAAVSKAVASLSSRTLSSVKRDGNALVGKVTSGENELLFTSLPSDGGWTVLVDGRRVETSVALGCFLTVPLGEAGTHTVSISRMLPESPLPVLLTCLGIALLGTAVTLESLMRIRKKALPYYAERTAGKEAQP